MSRPSTNGSSIRSALRRSIFTALAFETRFGQNVARSGIRKCSGSRDGPCAPTARCPTRCGPHLASKATTIGCRCCCTLRRRRNCGAWRTRLDATFCQAWWRRRRRPTDRSSRGGEADAIPASSRNCRSEPPSGAGGDDSAKSNVAQGVVLSAVLDTIPAADRQRLRLDWMTEPCGVVDARSGHGWLLRRLPRFMTTPGATTLLPLFSLISSDGQRVPLLVRLVRRSRRRPEDFILETLIRPVRERRAYLLFEQGVQHEGHTQNVLLEVAAGERLTGRLVLRDLTDTSVNIAFRVAKGKPLPRFPRGSLPRAAPFSIAGNAGDHHTNFRRPRILRGFDTVERYGLGGFVWPINTIDGEVLRRLRRHSGRDALSRAVAAGSDRFAQRPTALSHDTERNGDR